MANATFFLQLNIFAPTHFNLAEIKQFVREFYTRVTSQAKAVISYQNLTHNLEARILQRLLLTN